MAIIVKIRPVRGRKPKYRVALDTEDSFEISDWTVGKFGLRSGDEISAENIAEIKNFEAETAAKGIAVNFLSYRVRSSREVVDHLVKKRFSDDLAERVAARLREAGMIDDLAFARTFARDQLRKRCGSNLIRQKLLAKGINREMTEAVLAELIVAEEQSDAAAALAARRIQLTRSSFAKIDVQKRKKRIFDFLIRKGFSTDIAQQTIHTLFAK